jgi:ABC-type transporter Mla subunit MlaD
MLRGMELDTLSLNYQQLSSPQREIAQNLLLERLDDTVTAIHQNADPPGSALREKLDQTKAAIQKYPDAADAQRALVDLTQRVIDTLDELGPDAPLL